MPLYVEEAGSGPALLLLHGIGSSAASFHHQLEFLSLHRRVLAWDAPGFGRSDDPPGPPGMDGYADAAARVLEQFDAAPAHVLGASFGGVIGVRLALRHPGAVRSLILADSTPGSGTDPAKAAAMRGRGDELAEQGPHAFAAQRARRLLSPAAPSALVDDVRRNIAQSTRLPGYAWAAEAMADTDHRPDFKDVQVPTLVLCGAEDQVCPPPVSKAMAKAIPGARLALIDGAGHVSYLEQPDRFNELVEGFLDEVEDEPAATATPIAASRQEQR
jgi:3-oxoadipate enol-lactonase